jgi:Flp pilus assembly protein TadG
MQPVLKKSRPGKPSLRKRRAAVSVEAVFALPILLMFLMGILEYGRYIMTQQVLTNAAREGARYALAHTESVTLMGSTYTNQTSDVQAEVTRASAGVSLGSQTVQVYASDSQGNNLGNWIDASAGQGICVRISGTYTFVIPKLLQLPSTRTVTAQAIMRSEGN